MGRYCHANAGKEFSASINNIWKKFMEMLLKFISSSKWMPKDLIREPLWRNMKNVIKIA